MQQRVKLDMVRTGIVGLSYFGFLLAVDFGKKHATVGVDLPRAEKPVALLYKPKYVLLRKAADRRL